MTKLPTCTHPRSAMRPPFSWLGGKIQAASHLIALFPPQYRLYVEVFGGSAALLFALPKGHCKHEVYNDLDADLVNLWRQIQENHAALTAWLEQVPVSRRLFAEYFRACREEQATLDPLTRAKYFLYILKVLIYSDVNKKRYHTFCPIKNASSRTSISSTVSFLRNTVTVLEETWSRIKDVVLEEADFSRIINTYGRFEQALLYVDPPYAREDRSYRACRFDEKQHRTLARLLNETQAYVLLNYEETDEMRPLLEECYPVDKWQWFWMEAEYNAGTSMIGHRPPCRLLCIRNYTSPLRYPCARLHYLRGPCPKTSEVQSEPQTALSNYCLF